VASLCEKTKRLLIHKHPEPGTAFLTKSGNGVATTAGLLLTWRSRSQAAIHGKGNQGSQCRHMWATRWR
jgi:hypothetical protein